MGSSSCCHRGEVGDLQGVTEFMFCAAFPSPGAPTRLSPPWVQLPPALAGAPTAGAALLGFPLLLGAVAALSGLPVL